MGKRSLVALDTQHIKAYVFETGRLKEIRGASSILDRLNRQEMRRAALQADQNAVEIFANGGSGLYAIDSDCVETFRQLIQNAYETQTKVSSSITCAIQAFPENIPDDKPGLLDARLKDELELLRFRLQKKKSCPPEVIAFPSHPFMYTCNACGMRYARDKDTVGREDPDEPDEGDTLYCKSCLEKRREDRRVKSSIRAALGPERFSNTSRISSPLWERVINCLRDKNYPMPPGTKRPDDFNDFRLFGASKDYLGLIYADGNNMGAKTEQFSKLQEWQDFAKNVDGAVYAAVCQAIENHLPVQQFPGQEPLFPFDILLLGGDDILIVTPADVALDVALTIARTFHEEIRRQHTLSIGVILAPIKYPFGLLLDLAEGTLEYAKRAGVPKAERPADEKQASTEKTTKEQGAKAEERTPDESFINFMVVTGSTSQSFERVYKSLRDEHARVSGRAGEVAFYATLRPYKVGELSELLDTIREGKRLGLGRTKLHQVREAVLQMNLAGSVNDGLAVLRNWRSGQQKFVLEEVYGRGYRSQVRYRDEARPETFFPRVTFPWFADGPNAYRTSLLDFVELYDFVAPKGGNDAGGTEG